MIVMNEYYGAYPQNDYRYYLQHSAKGTTWKKENPKYVSIKNGKYIYMDENPTEERINEFNVLKRKKKNARKVYKKMKEIDNKRVIESVLNDELMKRLGTDEGKRISADRREPVRKAFNATRAKSF